MRLAELNIKDLGARQHLVSLATAPVLCICSSILPVYTLIGSPFPEPDGNAHMCIQI